MQYDKSYKERFANYFVSIKEAVSVIRSGDYIVTGMLEPKGLLWALRDRDDLTEIGLYCSQSLQGVIGDVALNTKSNITVYTSFIDPHEDLQKANMAGKIEFLPGSFSSWPKMNRKKGCNVMMVSVTPPDHNGYMSLSTYPEHVAVLMDEADLLIGEISENIATTFGGPLLHVSDFHKLACAETDWEFLIRNEVGEYWKDAQAKKMGAHLSELIPDGSTIELGVGSMNGNAMLNMEHVQDLGVHTEYYGEVLMELTLKGVINNSSKNLHKGFSIATIGSGSRKFYDFVHNNRSIKFMPSDYVLDIRTITLNKKFHAINTAAQVDLYGQVNGEFIKGRQYSGIGGQGDFAKAACLLDDGKSIIAMASTTANGKYSKIVPVFERGIPVTTPRTDVEYLVTEYGTAQLVGQTTKERARNIISVANPQFRDELMEEAKKIGIL
jgi:4-hydroxybutyrate CoA-transferase